MFNPLFKKNQTIIMVKQTIVFVLIAVTILSGAGPASAATFTATQTNWSGGSSASTITHNPASGVTSWGTQYSAKDASIATVGGGADLELSLAFASTSQTTDTHFNSGTFSQAVVSGTGSAANVQLAQNTIQLSAGISHTFALKSDGTVWAWGQNNFGQLGDNTVTQRDTPVQVSGLTGVTALGKGSFGNHSLALKSDGTVWAWGYNFYGQLGDNTVTQRNIPVQVLKGASGGDTTYLGDGATKVTAIAMGENFSLALKSDGTVWAWGQNNFGQLGDNTVTQRNTPVQVLGVGGSGYLTGITAISAGRNFTLTLKSDGTVWGWGINSLYQLGDNTVTQRNTPVQASGLIGVTSVRASYSHSLALKSDGTVWGWGNGVGGQLGDGSTNSRSIPTQVPGFAGAIAISTGSNNTFALKSDGTVWAWGQNNSGQLGDNTVTLRTTPVQVLGVGGSGYLTGVISTANGNTHSLALKSDGTVWGWGSNNSRQLGDNTTTDRYTPIQTLTSNLPADYLYVGTFYKATGAFTSQSIDTASVRNFDTLTYSLNTPAGTSITVDVRSGNVSTPDGSWTAWQTGVASGGSISAQNGHRYIQYRVNLASDGAATPQLNDITINYSSYPASQALTSVPYDSSDTANIVSQIQWGSAVTGGTTVKFQLRSSADNVTWSGWMGPTGTSTSYFVDPFGGEAMPAALTSSSKWIQYKAFMTSDGIVTPILSNVSVIYVVNATPEFDTVATTTAIQSASSSDPNWGKVSITYNVRDTDTTSGSFTPGFITPSFEYTIGGGWIAIATSSLASGDTNAKAVNTSTYTSQTAIWDAKIQLPEIYATNLQVRVTATDNEPANATVQSTSAATILDTKMPVTSASPSDAVNGVVSYSATDNSNITYRTSNNTDLSYDNMNVGSGTWTDAATTSVNASTTWTFTGDPSHQTVYFQVQDIYGNVSTTTNALPMRPGNFDIKDTSNLATNDFREFLSWKSDVATTTAGFSRYEIWRNENSGAFSLYQTINTADGGPGLNYFTDTIIASSTTYGYKLRVIDTDGDTSPWASNMPTDIPDGQGGSDFTPPTITNPLLADRQATWAKVTFTTDELVFGSVAYKKSNGSGLTTASSSSLGTNHTVVLSNLTPGADYLYKIVADDIFGNKTTLDNGGAWYSFAAKSGPRVSDVTSVLTDDKNATVVWNTDTDSNSSVTYATSISTLNTATGTTVTAAALVDGPPYQHRINLSDLSPRTTYWYSVSSTDADGNTTIDKNNLSYYSFTTSYDQKAPVISDISVPVAAPNSVVVYWKTDELTNATLSIGTASSTYSTSSADTVMSITHAVAISGLTANTTYHYQVRSCDPAGNCTDSADNTLKTAKDGEVTIVTVGGGGGAGQFTEAPTPKDTTAPMISNIQIATTTAFGATITFATNEATRTFINYGTSLSYDRVAGDSNPQLDHVVRLSGLRAGTEYHFRISALDAAGNETLSEDRIFSTKFISERSELLKTLENIQQYESEVEESIESILPSILPPFVELPQVYDVTEDAVTITWRTNIKSYGVVSYATEAEYATSTQYTSEVSDITTKTREHTLNLVGLKSNTRYHFKAKSFSLPQVAGESKDLTFTTKASRVAARVINIKNTSFNVVWTTEDAASTIVEYKNVRTGEIQRKIDERKVKEHDMLVERLLPATTYTVSVFGYNENSNLIEGGEPTTVATIKDIAAPKIANFKVDGALVPGRTDRVQTVVTWITDEPSNSTVYYQEGAGKVENEFANKSQQLDTYTNTHAIILSSLKPGTIYQMKIESIDSAGNKATFGPRTIITPQKGESIFDVIFKNFEDTFKFLRGAGQ